MADSSSETLVQQLNHRAKMLNPAWVFFFLGVAIIVVGWTLLPLEPSANHIFLPGVGAAFSYDRANNVSDEFARIVTRYGKPSSFLPPKTGPLIGRVPTRVAIYDRAGAKVILVANGCVASYQKARQLPPLSSGQLKPVRRNRPVLLEPCLASLQGGWTIVSYARADSDEAISNYAAEVLLWEGARRDAGGSW